MSDDSRRATRRGFLAGAGAAGFAGLAGCTGPFGENETGTPTSGGGPGQGSGPGQIGSGRKGRGPQGGTPMADLPDLSGELHVYSGRGQALVGELVSYIEKQYPDLTLTVRYGSSTDLVNKILTEGQNTPADVFYSVNAGSLGALAARGRTAKLPSRVTSTVPEAFRDPGGQWVGISGRARTVPYNTNAFSASDIPDDVFAFPNQERFAGKMAWAPSYGSFQAFVTAMRILNGKQRTRKWLRGMIDAGTREYADEFRIAQAIADGEVTVGFTNHYYVLRVLDGRPKAPLNLAFTKGDAGSMFNVAGAAVVNTANDKRLAANFVRHLLSAEAQNYFATTTFEYPLIPDVSPVQPAGIDLPSIDQLNPPKGLDLTQLSDLGPTIELMRDVGLSV